jgi:hypothetical protein
MAWLYVPDSDSWKMRCDSLYLPIKLFASWSGARSALPLSSSVWKGKRYIARLSGLTCKPSTAAHGVASWISSLRDSLVNPGARPEGVEAPTMIDGCGPISPESLPSANRASSSLRMSKDSRRGGGLACVLADLAAIGFDAEWDVFSAAGVGAPHRRRRLFVVARRVPDGDGDGDGLWDFAERGASPAQTTDGGDPEPFDLGTGNMGDARSDGRKPGRVVSVESPGGGSSRRDLEAMANSHRPQGVGLSMQGGTDDRTRGDESNRRDRPLWPPAPDDLHAWRRVQAGLKPAICRVAHGSLANRREWLHALGNGLVPLVGAYAFRTLSARLDKPPNLGDN